MENKAKKNDKFDPADLKPEDMMKFEIATGGQRICKAGI